MRLALPHSGPWTARHAPGADRVTGRIQSRHEHPLVAPIINGDGFARSRGFTVSLADAGTTTTGVVLCRQVRTLDIEARQGRWVKSVPPEVMDDVLAKLANLVS